MSDHFNMNLPMAVQKKRLQAASGKDNSWILYILKCNDGSFYTGITNDLARRFNQHRDGRASRYTRSRRPVRMVYGESCASRSHAQRRESAVKALSRKEKEALINPSHL
jgi:predicted GIY-YIG superfamily endonuclease